jgi:gamma-glutamyl-gamma-aminobutyrate hydrolase PuuD
VEGLFVEAVARDGLVEAISLIEHPFAIGVQWHPELNYAQDGFFPNFILRNLFTMPASKKKS